MGEGGPTLAALAALCARTLAESWETGAATRTVEPNVLSDEAKAILFLAQTRGVIEVRGVKTAFEAPGRLLAIYVEVDEAQDRRLSQPGRAADHSPIL